MTDDKQDQDRRFHWGLPASVAVHLVALAILILGLPDLLPKEPEEQVLEVELVPPAEPESQAEAEPEPEPEQPPQEQEPPPPEEQAAEEEAEPPPPPPGDEDGIPVQDRILNPVFQFGEEESGPRQDLEGNSAQEPEPAEEPVPEEQNVALPPELTAEGSDQQIPLAAETEPAEDAREAQTESSVTLEEARTLFSRSATSNPVAVTAMNNLPRDMRGGQLCVTELREQLYNAWPPYMPDLLPTQRLEFGNVINAPNAAFRQNGEWYELGYRCEVDAEATRVVGFSYGVGGRIPREDWRRRGLPGG